MDADFKWKSGDDEKVPEVVEWLKSLTHENLIDLWLMLNWEMYERGMPGGVNHKAIVETAQHEKLAEEMYNFCRPS